MKIVATFCALIWATMFASCKENNPEMESHPAKITVHLTDDTGTPIADFPIRAATTNIPESLSKLKTVYLDRLLTTDRTGNVVFELPVWLRWISIRAPLETWFLEGGGFLPGKSDYNGGFWRV